MINSTFYFEFLDSDACKAASNAWNIPITWIVNISGATVLDANLSSMEVDERNSREGWRQEGSILYISVLAGNPVQFNLSEVVEYDIVGRTQFFNNKSAALTIGGHSTTDLFKWSKRFDDHDFLKFTWLISPRDIDEGLEWLPYVGVGVLLASVSGIWLVLKKDALAYSKAEDLMPSSDSGDSNG